MFRNRSCIGPIYEGQECDGNHTEIQHCKDDPCSSTYYIFLFPMLTFESLHCYPYWPWKLGLHDGCQMWLETITYRSTGPTSSFSEDSSANYCCCITFVLVFFYLQSKLCLSRISSIHFPSEFKHSCMWRNPSWFNHVVWQWNLLQWIILLCLVTMSTI